MAERSLAVAGLLLGLGSLVVLAAQALQWSAVPEDDDWAAAARSVRSQWEDTDAFMVEPYWESTPRVYMGNAQYIPTRDIDWHDVALHPRVWVISVADRLDRATARMPSGWQPTGAAQRFGSVVAQKFVRNADATRWDVLSALPDARVERRYGDRVVKCDRWRPGVMPRWDCPKPDRWLYVGEALEPVSNEMHRCLWAMPVDGQGQLAVAFEGVPAGRLVGRMGQTLPAVRSQRGQAVKFAVEGGGKTLFSHVLGINDEGYLPWTVAEFPGGRLEFQVSSKNQLDRFFCFTARIVPEVPGRGNAR